MITVYFDTNIYHHIYKRYHITEADYKSLVHAIQTKQIIVCPSPLNIEEMLGAFEKYPQIARNKIKLLIDLADFDKLIKPPDMLLQDDIRYFVSCNTSGNNFLSNPYLRADLLDFLDPEKEDIAKILSIVREIKEQKQQFKDKMILVQEKVKPVAMQLKHKVNGFMDYWEYAQLFAEKLAERSGALNGCKMRGIGRLLDVRSIRLAVGAHLSYIYAHNFEGQTPKIGDSRDLQHAVTAAAANIFVIEDGKFERLLQRVPMEKLEIMKLRGLLDRIT